MNESGNRNDTLVDGLEMYATQSCIQVLNVLIAANHVTTWPLIVWSVGSIYATVVILSIVTNITVVVTVLVVHHQHTAHFALIGALASADLFVAMFSGVVTPITWFNRNWLFGFAACKILPSIQSMSVSMSLYTMGLIAVSRYKLIIGARRTHSHWRKIKRVIGVSTVLIGCLSLVLGFLPMFYQKLKSHEAIGKTGDGRFVKTAFCGLFCMEQFPDPLLKKLYSSAIMLQFVGLLAIILFCYRAVFHQISKSVAFRHRYLHNLISLSQQQSNASRSAATSRNQSKSEDGNISLLNMFRSRREAPPWSASYSCSSVQRSNGSQLPTQGQQQPQQQQQQQPNGVTGGMNLIPQGSFDDKADTVIVTSAEQRTSAALVQAQVSAKISDITERMNRMRSTNTILVAMVLTYVCCWGPYLFLNLICDFGLIDSVSNLWEMLLLLSHLLAMCSTVTNPILYGVSNRQLRRALAETMRLNNAGHSSYYHTFNTPQAHKKTPAASKKEDENHEAVSPDNSMRPVRMYANNNNRLSVRQQHPRSARNLSVRGSPVQKRCVDQRQKENKSSCGVSAFSRTKVSVKLKPNKRLCSSFGDIQNQLRLDHNVSAEAVSDADNDVML